MGPPLVFIVFEWQSKGVGGVDIMRVFTSVLICILILAAPVMAEEVGDLDYILTEMRSDEFNESNRGLYKLDSDSENHKEAMDLFQEGYINMRQFDYQAAYDKFNESLSLLEEEPLPRLEIELLFYLSELDIIFQNTPKALSKSLKLMELSTESGIHHRLVDAYYNLALGYRFYYDERESKLYADKAFRLSHEVDCEFGIALYYSYLGDTALIYEDNPEEAMAYYRDSRDLMPEKAYHHLVMDYRGALDMAMIYTRINHLDDELAINDLNMMIEKANTDNHFQMYGLYMMAGDYYSDRDKAKALDNYMKSLASFKKISHIEGSQLSPIFLKMALGNIYYDTENYDMAAGLYNEILTEEGNSGLLNLWVEGQSSLEDNKHRTFQQRVSLLEELNTTNEEKAELSQLLTYIFIVATVILILLLITILKSVKETRKIQKKLYKASITDSMTKAYNRGKIMEILAGELCTNDAVAMIDVDDFKLINDKYGHLVGDEVLIKISETIMGSIRENDSVGRYGGEEFLVHFKDVSLEEAIEISERIRENIMNLEWVQKDLRTTISVGISMCRDSKLDDVLSYADRLLYHAKTRGKNQVVTEL